MGMQRVLGGAVTAHGLAVRLAEGPADVSGLTTRVRNIAIAGREFGLIERAEAVLGGLAPRLSQGAAG